MPPPGDAPQSGPTQTPEQIAAEAAKKTAEAAQKPPEQTATTPVPVETAAHAQARADLQSLQQDVLKSKPARQEELKRLAAQQRHPESWINNQPQKADFLSGKLLSSGIESGVTEKVKEYTPMLKQFGMNDQNIDTIGTAAKEFLMDYASKNGNDILKTRNYATTEMPNKLKGLFDGLTATFNSKNFPFQSQMDCLTRFNDFAGLGIITNGLMDKNNFKNFLALTKGDFDSLLTGFNEYLALEKDIKGKTLAAPGSPETPATAGKVETGAATPSLPNAPATTASATPPANPTATPAATEAPPAAAVAAAMGEIDTGMPFLDTLAGILISIFPKAAKWLESMGWVQTTEFAGLEGTELAEAQKFKNAAKDYGLNLETLAPLFKSKPKTTDIIKKMKDENITSWKDYFDKYLDPNEKDKLSHSNNLNYKEIAEMFLTNKVAESGAAGSAAAAAAGIGERAMATPAPAAAPQPAPTPAPTPTPAPAAPQSLSAADKADIARARAGLPAGAKGVSSVPQDVALAAQQTLAETSGQDYGVKKIITGSDGKQYAMVREKHSGDSGHPNVHPGVSAVEVPPGSAPPKAPGSAAA